MEYRTESSYRKRVAEAKKFYENVFSHMVNDEYAREILKQKDELYKIKRQVFDQRREYNKLLTSDSRADHLTEQLLEVAKNLEYNKPLDFNIDNLESNNEKEAVICFSDWHYGMITDNIWNTYNIDILKSRLTTFVEKAVKHIKLHKPSKLHILILGDMANGAIHTTSRVSSEEETCDQLMNVSELLAETIDVLSGHVKETAVYSTYGNHMRTVQNKKDSVHSDNMEKIIPWWLEQRLNKKDNVEIVYAEYKEFIKFKIFDYNICATHGDLDRFKDLALTVNTIFSKKFGETIDYTISGDKHHLEEFEQFDIESILIRSLCGSEEYANVHRLYSSPGQSLIIFNEEDGRECTYNIKLK